MRLLIYGYGFAGRALARRMQAAGWDVAATFRDPAAAEAMRANGVTPLPADDKAAIAAALADVQAVLVTPPPGPDGCPALQVLVPALASAGAFPDWIGYLSTTGVYGDRRGGWVFEESRLAAQSLEGARRVAALVAEGVKLLDIAQLEAGLLGHEGAQAQLESAMRLRIERAERQA